MSLYVMVEIEELGFLKFRKSKKIFLEKKKSNFE